MRISFVRRIIIIIGIIISISFLLFWIFQNKKSLSESPLLNEIESVGRIHTVIGQSLEGRNIDAYTYGKGKTHLVFVGGIHGGYEWNTVLLAYKFLDYLNTNKELVPSNLTVTVIPSANPDGLFRVTGLDGRFTITDVPTDKEILASGRFNGNGVDLNRNFDCKWQPKSMWQSKTVSAGKAPFSEPEAKALRDFSLKNNPTVVVFWHSQSGNIYASKCEKGILGETENTMNVYSRGSGYPALKTFDAYITTGGADDWLASIGIPAFTVELKTHKTIEWEQNLAGIKALFEYYK